jgi:hypothetical protein
MGWISGEEARQAMIGEGRATSDRQTAANRAAKIECVMADVRTIRRLSAEAERVPGLTADKKFLAENDCDLLGAVTAPPAIQRQEEIYAEIRHIQRRHVDPGDGQLYATPEEHLEWLRSTDSAPIGAAYTYTLLHFWPTNHAIEDTADYVLEDGRRFGSAADAQRADRLEIEFGSRANCT